MRTNRSIFAVLVILLALVGGGACGETDDAPSSGGSTSSTAADRRQRCEATEYSVSVPDGWQAVDLGAEMAGVVGPCQLFDTRAHQARPSDGPPEVPVRLDVVAEVSDQTPASSAHVPLSGGLRLVATAQATETATLEQATAVRDDILGSLEIPERPRCSAAELDADLPAQGLPPAVDRTRSEIASAAAACDYARLDELAGDEGFSYTFGLPDARPSLHWRQSEAGGGEPMRYLVGVLRLSPAELDEGRGHAWPAAFAEEWGAVSAEHKQELRPLYDADDLQGFEQYGAYIGYRAVIAADGTWTAFIAGD